MQNARFDYIAFLDADDYYLPDKASPLQEMFAEQADREGVYESSGYARGG